VDGCPDFFQRVFFPRQLYAHGHHRCRMADRQLPEGVCAYAELAYRVVSVTYDFAYLGGWLEASLSLSSSAFLRLDFP
jgi:hypothetical protein